MNHAPLVIDTRNATKHVVNGKAKIIWWQTHVWNVDIYKLNAL